MKRFRAALDDSAKECMVAGGGGLSALEVSLSRGSIVSVTIVSVGSGRGFGAGGSGLDSGSCGRSGTSDSGELITV